jgi:4-aminobutyrate aminotransferase-like enzyme
VQEVATAVDSLQREGLGVSAMLVCPIFANEGLPDVPPQFMERAIACVRAAGGLYIADEVQAGFARTGRHMWGYRSHAVVPDIVTLGKPMGNGHPLGGVVARREIVASYRRQFSYFNTFAGNAVACAAGNAVLDVIEREGLLKNALEVGAYLKQGLKALQRTHVVIGDVRGSGLFLGVELVVDPISKVPASKLARFVVNAMRERGVLISKIGLHDNILKMRPPLPFAKEHADLLITTLDQVLAASSGIRE